VDFPFKLRAVIIRSSSMIRHRGRKRLRSDGVLDQLCSALLAYANKPGRTKTYEPEAVKRLLKQSDPTWKSEVRVPPYDSQYDNLPINERFDLFRVVSDDHGSTYGVGVEIEQWEIQNDLLKIRRAIQRRQIGVGAVILGSASNLDYVVSHLPVNEPLLDIYRSRSLRSKVRASGCRAINPRPCSSPTFSLLPRRQLRAGRSSLLAHGRGQSPRQNSQGEALQVPVRSGRPPEQCARPLRTWDS